MREFRGYRQSAAGLESAWWWETGGTATLEARRVSGLRVEQGRVVEAKQREIQKSLRVDLGGDQESIKQKAHKYFFSLLVDSRFAGVVVGVGLFLSDANAGARIQTRQTGSQKILRLGRV